MILIKKFFHIINFDCTFNIIQDNYCNKLFPEKVVILYQIIITCYNLHNSISRVITLSICCM